MFITSSSGDVNLLPSFGKNKFNYGKYRIIRKLK